MATQASYIERQFDENWQTSLAAVGIRIRFETAQWSENYKAAHAGRLQMWSLGHTATTPDAQPVLEYMYGPASGSGNLARFRLAAFDELYRRMLVMPDSPQRARLYIEASMLVAAYMPYKIQTHRVYIQLNHPWITGFRQSLFRHEIWQYIEVDAELRDRLTG